MEAPIGPKPPSITRARCPTFRLLYVFVVIHHRSRRLVHVNVTEHPTSDWTLQPLREAVGDEAC